MNIPGSLSYINGLRELAVLVVDHDPASTQRITLQLEDANCDAVCLSSCAEALSYLTIVTRRLDLILVNGRLPHVARLAGSIRTRQSAGDLPLYAVAGCRVHDFRMPQGMDGLLPKPLPSGATLYGTLHDLIDHTHSISESFVPLGQVAEQLGLTHDQARQQFYTPVLAGIGPAVRASEVAVYAQYSGGLEYAGAIRQAFMQAEWRELSWRSRACLFNEGLPPVLRLHWRSLKRIAQGQDRELARAIRVLAALDLKLGLDLDALSGSQAYAEQHATEGVAPC